MPRLLRPRFSLLALLALVAAVGVFLGLVVEPYRAQQRAVEELRRRGHHVSVEPNWLGRQTGLVLFDDAILVFFFPGKSEAPCEEDLRLLGQLPRLKDLAVHRINDEELLHLNGLTGLRSLRVSGTQVTARGRADVARALPGLRYLDSESVPGRGQ